ncbi:Cullin-domain-containing protein [Atractiella rhizophila]|nr:Cullin-domain-containing protein [Atractiella rhizophila]
MDDRRLDDIRSLASLLRRVDLLKSMRDLFQSHLKTLALACVLPPIADNELVPCLLELKTRSDEIVEKLGGSKAFKQAQRDAFESAINARENKPAECIARFVDQKLRTGNKEMSDAEMEEALNGALWIFRLTQGKDVFEAHFQRDLARRLLLNKSASTDTERRLLLKLREECGAGWTAKLETMFKDIEVSNDFMKLFKLHAPTSELHVYVLSRGNWPSYPPMDVIIPESMQSQLDKFKYYYVSKHSGRKLQFEHSLTSVTLKTKFKRGTKELNLALSQCVIMLLFEDKKEDEMISYEAIRDETKLEEKTLKLTLQSLACGKVRVLTKHPKGRDVDETDEFSFNHLFKDDHYRLKINQIQLKESTEENEKTNERVLQDRRPYLEAAIVRILKSRKTLKHSELIMELIGQIKDRFKVDMSEVKKAIDSLIEREYMERADGKRDVYNYLA